MIALGGPKLKQYLLRIAIPSVLVSMIALGGPKLKLRAGRKGVPRRGVSMIALGGPKLKQIGWQIIKRTDRSFNDSTGWA